MALLNKEESNAKEIHTKDKNTEDANKKPFYGDLVCAVAFTAVTPVDGSKAVMTCREEDSEVCRIAILSVAFCALYGGLNWVAYLKHSHAFSSAAFLAGLWLCAFNNVHGWPYPGECVITPQFQGVMVGTLVNGSLTFRNKLIRFGLMFAVASYVSIMSPYSVYKEDVLPLLGGPIALSILCLSWNRFRVLETKNKNINWNALTVKGARYLLAVIFAHHTAGELLSMTKGSTIVVQEIVHHTAMDTLWTLAKASFVACVGVAATGTFQNEIDLNEKLEVLVRERTKEIREKNDKLHMVEMALRASETAIAITDSNGTIIWLNAACEEITSFAKSASSTEPQQSLPAAPPKHRQVQETNKSLLGRQLVEVLNLETIRDEKKLAKAFSNYRREDEVCIHETIYHLEVSPYQYSVPTTSDSQNNNKNKSSINGRFMVVLKNITAERARDVAEKVAREEAMLAEAMGDSMVTLTVSWLLYDFVISCSSF